MKHDYIFLRKCVLVLMVIGVGQSLSLFSAEAPQNGDQEGWVSCGWKTMSHPVVAPVIFLLMNRVILPGVEIIVDDTYLFFLTDEQKEIALKQRSEERQAERDRIESVRTELQLRRDPRWKDLTFAEALDTKRLREQNLRENDILLARAERENEESEIEHLRKIMQNASPEKRTEAQEKLDAYVNARMKVRLEKAMGN